MAENNLYKSNEDDIKPNISLQEIEIILEKFYGLEGGKLKELQGYDDLNFHYIPKYNRNPNIQSIWSHGYVLKILNSLDSKINALCEAQNKMMLFLKENNIPSPIPVKNLFGKYYVKEKFPQNSNDGKFQKEHILRLLEYQPGTILKDIPKSYSLFHHLGIFVAKLDEVLKKFSHSVFDTHHSIWQLHSVPELKPWTNIVGDEKRKQLVEIILNTFIEKVLSKEKDFEKGMIHGDINEHNILVSKCETGEWKVSAVLDFGDSHQSCYLFELAISLCYMMFECKRHGLDPVVGAGYLLAGYLKTRPNFIVDFELLKICICARICQSLVLGLKSFSLHPENTYVLDSQQMGWPLLEELWCISVKEISNTWHSVINHTNNFLQDSFQ